MQTKTYSLFYLSLIHLNIFEHHCVSNSRVEKAGRVPSLPFLRLSMCPAWRRLSTSVCRVELKLGWTEIAAFPGLVARVYTTDYLSEG